MFADPLGQDSAQRTRDAPDSQRAAQGSIGAERTVEAQAPSCGVTSYKNGRLKERSGCRALVAVRPTNPSPRLDWKFGTDSRPAKVVDSSPIRRRHAVMWCCSDGKPAMNGARHEIRQYPWKSAYEHALVDRDLARC